MLPYAVKVMFDNIHFAWPWLLWLLLLPLLIRLIVTPAKNTNDVLWMPYLDDLHSMTKTMHFRQTILPLLLAALAWLLLITAAARPQLVTEAQGLPISGRDLVVAVDLSESMRQTDFEIGQRYVNRLDASKYVAGEFITQREGDRIGLIVFGSQAYVQAPLTLDRKTVQILLDETSIGLAGSKTAIGDAIGLAVKRLRDSDSDKRVLILMTDGANTAGEVGPDVAARLASTAGLRIYTIGIGKQEEQLDDDQFVIPNTYGLDERILKYIANITGGKYYLASDTQKMQGIYEEINQLEPVITEGEQLYLHDELYMYPLALAIMLLLVSRFYARLQ